MTACAKLFRRKYGWRSGLCLFATVVKQFTDQGREIALSEKCSRCILSASMESEPAEPERN